ncbi:hypothetical protein BK123_18610 [Paenibacillus lautus]|uniref:Uncharacterized protein n=1 Tax=Paenibacillus lautus TaxID=1401 RepID=A0A1R1AZV0_PAELA|nr:hypothetical protein BK123_18610 [Paenibacillus lautus]
MDHFEYTMESRQKSQMRGDITKQSVRNKRGIRVEAKISVKGRIAKKKRTRRSDNLHVEAVQFTGSIKFRPISGETDMYLG